MPSAKNPNSFSKIGTSIREITLASETSFTFLETTGTDWGPILTKKTYDGTDSPHLYQESK